jgi:hypothetical protein
MPSLAHTHTYVKLNEVQWKCSDPYCTHFIDKDKLTGKISLCSVCKTREIVLTPQIMQRAEPRCLECSGTKEAKEFRDQKETLEKLLRGNEDAKV